jgi:hypothetical protein
LRDEDKTVRQTYYAVRYRQQSIHLREKNIVDPPAQTVIELQNCMNFAKKFIDAKG